MRSSKRLGLLLLLGVAATGCAGEVEGTGRSGGPAGDGRATSEVTSASMCVLYRPLLDEPVEGAAACGFASGHRDDDLYLARHLRSHLGQTTSFIGLGTVVLHDVLFQAMVGRALEPLGLGAWDGGLEHAFDPETGEYVVAAKSGLVVGNERLGEWDAMNARGEIRFRLYWGAGSLAGQPIKADLFTPSSYLRDPELHVDLWEQRVTVSYASAGPLAPVFGWGDPPPNPAVVRPLEDADRIRQNVASVMADARVIVRIGQPDCAYTSLEFVTPRRALLDWATDPDVALDFRAGETARAYPAAQKVTITTWDAKLAAEGDWLEGPVTFSSSRGFTGTIDLRRGDVVPDMSIACAR
jgi:hypothetical protein